MLMAEKITIQLDTGHIYTMSADLIWEDYLDCMLAGDYVKQEDAVTYIAGRKAEEPEFWKEWFDQQFDWKDVMSRGTLVSLPSAERYEEIAVSILNYNGSELKIV
jgi:hypothetical protein